MTDALTWFIWGMVGVLGLYIITMLGALIIALWHVLRGDR